MSTTAPAFKVSEIELHEIPVVLRMPFRFGVVTLRQCFQAFVRVRIEFANGAYAWGTSAEMVVPKWFDKNTALSDQDNFEQERDVLRIARESYLGDSTPASAFSHFARHHDANLAFCDKRGYNPLLASYGPALIDRALIDALCKHEQKSFYQVMQSNLAGISEEHSQFQDIDWEHFLSQCKPAQSIHARHTVGLVDAITTSDVIEVVNDGLPETLEQVVAHYGHRYYKLKVSGQIDKDIDRLTAIARVLERIPNGYQASLDGNEQYQSAQELEVLLGKMRETPALKQMMQSILFIEQPIARHHALDVDLKKRPLGLPVIIDESDGTLDAFVLAKEKGYAGISSKTCKGVYKSILNASRCSQWNQEQKQMQYFMSAEDLTVQAGISVQQDLALVNLIGVKHVERNGHHYVNGLASRPKIEQSQFLKEHADLYENTHGAVRLHIQNGQMQIGSLACVGFASAVEPDFSAMYALGQCPSSVQK